MPLKIAELAPRMKVPEKTILHWIRRDGLPAVLIDGEYQVNRSELLEWATEHGIKVPPELFPAPGGDPEAKEPALPSLSRALETGGIHCDVPGDDKLAVLSNVVGLLPIPPRMDPDFLLQVLMARETLGTTAVGNGIAIPHVRNPILLEKVPPSVTLCFLRKPIDFGAVDGKPVHILFTLTSPTVRSHLHLLSKLAFALRDPSFRQALSVVPCDGKRVLDTLRDLESQIAQPR